jgi:hypothetical protein
MFDSSLQIDFSDYGFDPFEDSESELEGGLSVDSQICLTTPYVEIYPNLWGTYLLPRARHLRNS